MMVEGRWLMGMTGDRFVSKFPFPLLVEELGVGSQTHKAD